MVPGALAIEEPRRKNKKRSGDQLLGAYLATAHDDHSDDDMNGPSSGSLAARRNHAAAVAAAAASASGKSPASTPYGSHYGSSRRSGSLLTGVGLVAVALMLAWAVAFMPLEVVNAVWKKPFQALQSGNEALSPHAVSRQAKLSNWQRVMRQSQSAVAGPAASELLVVLVPSADHTDPPTTTTTGRYELLHRRKSRDNAYKVGPEPVWLGESDITDPLVLADDSWLHLTPHIYAVDVPDANLTSIVGGTVGADARDVAVLKYAHKSRAGQFQWLVLGEYSTYFVLSNIRPFLADLDSNQPYFIGLPVDSKAAVCKVTDSQCKQSNTKPVATVPGAGYVISAGLLNGLSDVSWHRCTSETLPANEAGIKRIPACMAALGFGLTALSPGLLAGTPFNGDRTVLHPPATSPWPRPLSFHGIEGLPPDVFEIESMDSQDSFPITPCYDFIASVAPLSWKPITSKGSELGLQLAGLTGAWAVAFSTCRHLWAPWIGMPWPFGKFLQGVDLLEVDSYESFEKQANRDSLQTGQVLAFDEKLGSSPPWPTAVYTAYRLDRSGVSLNDFKETYVQLAGNLTAPAEVQLEITSKLAGIEDAIALVLNQKLASDSERIANNTNAIIGELIATNPSQTFLIVSEGPEQDEVYASYITSLGGKVITVPDDSLLLQSDAAKLQLISMCVGILQAHSGSSLAEFASVMGRAPILNLMSENSRYLEGPLGSSVGLLFELAFPWEARPEFMRSVKHVMTVRSAL